MAPKTDSPSPGRTELERRLAFWVCLLGNTLANVVIHEFVVPHFNLPTITYLALAGGAIAWLLTQASRGVYIRITGEELQHPREVMILGTMPYMLVLLSFRVFYRGNAGLLWNYGGNCGC